MKEEVNAAKDTVSGDAIWRLLGEADSIMVAQNKNILEFSPARDDREEILSKVAGRTGNLRAPTLRVGKTFYVGFNEELYTRIASPDA